MGALFNSTQGVAGVLGQTSTRDGQPVLILPYFDQGTAQDLIAAGKASIHLVADVIGQVAQGLDAMHRRGLLHRDVSPRNILRSSELGIALGDLGCARAINSTVEPPWTQALTPGFAAPETVTGQRVQLITSDVYGLAATAWALLVGEPPFGPPPPREAVQAQASYERARAEGPPRPEPLLTAGIDEATVRVLVQALHPDPSKRPPQARDVADALTAGQGPVTQTGSAAESVPIEIAGVPGPLQPPRPAQVPAPSTELSREARTATKSRRWQPGRRMVGALIVASCFLVAFISGRILTAGADDTSPRRPEASKASTTPGSSANAVTAPQDLRIVSHTRTTVTLRWTPPRGVNSVLQQSIGSGGEWSPLLQAQTDTGRVVLTRSDDGAGVCFRLIVVGAETKVSNRTCLSS